MGYNVAPCFEGITLRRCEILVLHDSFSEFGCSQRRVLGFVDVLVGALVDGVVAVFSNFHFEPILIVALRRRVNLLAFGLLVAILHHAPLVHEKVEAQVFLGRVEL